MTMTKHHFDRAVATCDIPRRIEAARRHSVSSMASVAAYLGTMNRALHVGAASWITLVSLAGVGCSRATATADPAASAAPVPVAAPAPTKSPQEVLTEKIGTATTLEQALTLAKPIMGDSSNETDVGAKLLALWAMNHMKWSDVGVAEDETSHALARKDSDEARGKRLCTTGTVIQIESLKSATGKYFTGLTMTGAGNIFHFTAVGSSGTLVARSSARLCGVVTGLYDYSNSGGGVGHAVELVGMFDLPENKAKLAKQ